MTTEALDTTAAALRAVLAAIEQAEAEAATLAGAADALSALRADARISGKADEKQIAARRAQIERRAELHAELEVLAQRKAAAVEQFRSALVEEARLQTEEAHTAWVRVLDKVDKAKKALTECRQAANVAETEWQAREREWRALLDAEPADVLARLARFAA